MSELVIQIKKKSDGSAALSCRRADGSVTWQRQEGQQGRFFPLHDLTHYAVETVLAQSHGFYSLVAEGWDLTDFGPPWRRGRIPAGAAVAELIVGFLDSERAAGAEWTAAEFNSNAELYGAEHGVSIPLRLTDRDLQRVREKRRELFALWAAVPKGETLELAFSRRAG